MYVQVVLNMDVGCLEFFWKIKKKLKKNRKYLATKYFGSQIHSWNFLATNNLVAKTFGD